MRACNIETMKQNGKVILLTASPETILTRVSGNDDNRPLLQGRKKLSAIQALMEQRHLYYEAAADLTIVTDGKQVKEICREIFQKLKE